MDDAVNDIGTWLAENSVIPPLLGSVMCLAMLGPVFTTIVFLFNILLTLLTGSPLLLDLTKDLYYLSLSTGAARSQTDCEKLENNRFYLIYSFFIHLSALERAANPNGYKAIAGIKAFLTGVICIAFITEKNDNNEESCIKKTMQIMPFATGAIVCVALMALAPYVLIYAIYPLSTLLMLLTIALMAYHVLTDNKTTGRDRCFLAFSFIVCMLLVASFFLFIVSHTALIPALAHLMAHYSLLFFTIDFTAIHLSSLLGLAGAIASIKAIFKKHETAIKKVTTRVKKKLNILNTIATALIANVGVYKFLEKGLEMEHPPDIVNANKLNKVLINAVLVAKKKLLDYYFNYLSKTGLNPTVLFKQYVILVNKLINCITDAQEVAQKGNLQQAAKILSQLCVGSSVWEIFGNDPDNNIVIWIIQNVSNKNGQPKLQPPQFQPFNSLNFATDNFFKALPLSKDDDLDREYKNTITAWRNGQTYSARQQAKKPTAVL